MADWLPEEEDGIVVAQLPDGRCRVQTASGHEVVARVSGFLWFRRVEPAIGSRVRITRPLDEARPFVITMCAR